MSRVTPNATGASPPAEDELDKLEELPDDAIVAHQQGAHVPKPRARITEESRSIVISDQPPAPDGRGAVPRPPRSQARRERTEKTVVIRSRRQVDELRRAVTRYANRGQARKRGVVLWVIVGLAAFLGGGLVALFAIPSKPAAEPPPPAPPQLEAPLPPPATPAESVEPPSVSIDELPIEGSPKSKK